MYSYTLDGKKFLIDALTSADVMSGELFALDRQYYPASIAWGKERWFLQLNSAQYKFALRIVSESGKKLIGNLVVCLTSGKRSKNPNELSYYISSLTIDTNYLRQGHAKHLMKAFASKILLSESSLQNISVSIPRNISIFSDIAESYGFKPYVVELNAIRYSIPIQDFIPRVMSKVTSLKFDLEKSLDAAEKSDPADKAKPERPKLLS